MKNIIINIFISVAILFVACNESPKFTIKGEISEGSGKSIYLSHVGIDKNSLIDSIKIKDDGKFEFKQPQPESYDFYRLQLGKKGRAITIAVDSTESINITANCKEFADNYIIEGSEESHKIQEISILRTALEKQINHFLKDNSLTRDSIRTAVYNITKEFKENIFKQYIMPSPDKASAYYALFLQTNGMYLFNPNANRFDSKCFAAVATALNNRYPESARAKNMYSIAMKGMQSTRPVTPDTIDAKEAELTTTGIFDIKLPNIKGDSISLSSLKGKVVFLDFITYSDTRTSEHTIALRELYTKYKEQGFEIYQVSFDADTHFWKTSADKLPWTCVLDGHSLLSSNALLYRVDKLPTYFLINRNNEIVMRDEQIKDIAAEIEKLLKE
jgi:peroxiredoxin